MVTERERRGETGGEKEHLEQEERRRNYRPGLRKQTGAGEEEQRLIKKQRGERGTRTGKTK